MIECTRCGIQVDKPGLCMDCDEVENPAREVKRRKGGYKVLTGRTQGVRLPESFRTECAEMTAAGESIRTIALHLRVSTGTVEKWRKAAKEANAHPLVG